MPVQNLVLFEVRVERLLPNPQQVGRIEGTFSSGQGGFGRDFRKLEIHPSVLSMRQHLQGYHLMRVFAVFA